MNVSAAHTTDTANELTDTVFSAAFCPFSSTTRRTRWNGSVVLKENVVRALPDWSGMILSSKYHWNSDALSLMLLVLAESRAVVPTTPLAETTMSTDGAENWSRLRLPAMSCSLGAVGASVWAYA